MPAFSAAEYFATKSTTTPGALAAGTWPRIGPAPTSQRRRQEVTPGAERFSMELTIRLLGRMDS
jgi:hypothetical protein